MTTHTAAAAPAQAPATLQDIESACRAARAARDILTERAHALQDEIAALQRRKLPGIRSAVAAVAEEDAALMALLQSAPGLFVKPRSVVLSGLQVGYTKGKGTIDFGDVAQTIKLIRKHLPDQADALIKVKETPIKAAIKNLPGGDLKKIGVTVQATGDVVFISDATDSVDKLVAALLKGTEEAAQGEDAEADE